ncbi:MMPL family transporter [Verrucomicrobia bacterium]|nr:MMPL family transporter [Verrucomicrobiota bacterium]
MIETDVMALLPKDRQNPVTQVAMDRVTGAWERKVIFLIEAAEKDQAVKAAEDFSSRLENLELVASVSGRVDADDQRGWSELYFPKRFQLLTEKQGKRLRTKPQMQVRLVQEQLYSPFAGVTGVELKNDSFLLFREFLSALTAQTGSFTLLDGFPSKSKGHKTYILITAEIVASAYGVNGVKLLPELQVLEDGLQAEHDVRIYHTGVLFYAADGIESAQREISTIGIGSLIGVLVLLIAVYRSPLPIFLSLLSIGCGLLSAFVLTVWIFGEIHLFSLVFGGSLIGISIDYAFHYLTHRLASGSTWQPEAGLRSIFWAITIGLITSLMGYAVLLAAPFPGLQQLAVFSTVGLTSAYATVVCWYPVLAAKPGSRSGLPLVSPMKGWLVLWNRPGVRIGLPLLIVGLAVPGLLRLSFNDDIRQMQALSPNLKAQERTIQSVLGMQNGQQLLLVVGHNGQEVLEQLQVVGKELNLYVEEGFLSDFQSLETYLQPISFQNQNYDLVKQLYEKQGKLLQQTLGLAEPPIFDTVFSPLTLSGFLVSPVSEPFRFLWLGELTDGLSGSVILLNGVKNEAILQHMAAVDPSVYYLNKATLISSLLGLYRLRITWLLLMASLLIWILLGVRFGLRKGTLVVLPPMVASVFSVSIVGLSGESLNIFNLLALAIVLGIGIDYTLFFAEHRMNRMKAGRELLSTQLAVSLAAATTILSFGLLALSATWAIHSFGATVLVGVFVSWLLAPLAMSVEGEE